MEKLYLGVDLHKRSCWVTVLDADGHLLESRRIGTEKWELLEFFGQVRKPAARSLDQLPGVGPFIAPLVMAEVEDIRRFHTTKHLVSFTGLAPSLYASGEHRWGGPITKQGSGVLRWALVQAAHRAALNPRFYGFYQRQRERHGASRAAVALARKLAVIIFYPWRHALHAQETLPQVGRVRERTSGGAWSEHRPSTSD